jgi:putative ATPase
MDLFEQHRQSLIAAEAPLAARMRPRTLDDYVGQDAIVGPGRLLRRAIQADQLSSLIFYGPPGTGKTTLAQVIAGTTKAHFIAINAVLSGVKDIRDAIATAQDLRGRFAQRTILFVDEVHRFNKAQQDALLPWVENGTVILIGATTENPYFEVNKALVSRSRLFQLKPLTENNLRQVVAQAIADPTRGYGTRQITLATDALDHLVNIANGDARTLLNALELAVETTPPDASGTIAITLAVAEESIQKRAVLYDKEGDAHFDTISAFIKSIRGSDPDAALYWLARMVYAGEDPRFILRRLLILASEDVGLADPQAVGVVNSCAMAFDRVGMPEGRYPLAQATLYLATCAKSNSVMGFFDALAAVEQEREAQVPNPLRDPSRDKESFGHGKGYLYPHAYRDHWVEQQYLPTSLQGQVFYQPSSQGYEKTIQVAVARKREAQLAALVETIGPEPMLETLTYGPPDKAQERWLERAMGNMGEHLRQTCSSIFTHLNPQRHHVILDLHAKTGLLTWEAIRQAPEGGVYTCVQDSTDYAALLEQINLLNELSRPVLFQAQPDQLSAGLTALTADELKFDGIVGRNALMTLANKAELITQLASWLQPHGKVVLSEGLAVKAQRLYDLLPPVALPQKVYQRWQQAEESLYTNSTDPRLNWHTHDFTQALTQAGFTVTAQEEHWQSAMMITEALLQRWFGDNANYRTQLAEHLKTTEIEQIIAQFRQTLLHQTVGWQRCSVLLQAQLTPIG